MKRVSDIAAALLPTEYAIERAFRAGWATGFQECAEGATINWSQETGDRPALETAALERWRLVEAALVAKQE
jgi:hypothetical protein